jgi:hypothetical protein
MSIPAKIPKRKLRKIAAQTIADSPNAAAALHVPNNANQEKRMQALDLVFGMWKDRDDVPKDGLAFQQEMRKEW